MTDIEIFAWGLLVGLFTGPILCLLIIKVAYPDADE
jgi:hypothetical protein